jgi:CubicO group peptidase (beta-lactamase class C family)
MLAVQDELVDLDTPITAYLPEFTVNSSFEDRPEQRMTLRHLLNHTAGFTHEAPVGNNFNPASPSWRAHVASISDTSLKFPVGERYSYSNLGIEIAAYIVQEVSGVPFETFVQRRIFEPLGMRSSFVNTPTRNGNCDACARGHNRWFTSLPTYIPMEGAGGVRMTLDDAVRYVQFHLNRGRVGDAQVLATRFFDEMYRPSVEIASSEPMLRYGLGFYLWGDFAGTYSVHHQGTGFGFSASMRWYPEYGIGMVLLLNTVDRGRDWDVGTPLLMAMIKQGLVTKTNDPSVPDADRFYEQVEATKRRHPLSEPGETPYREEWGEYIGKYCARYGGAYVLNAEVDTSSVCFRVFEQDGYLYHGGGLHESGGQRTQRLIEREPRLFFAERSGEALDLRSDPPTFRNIELRRRE